MVKDFFFSRVCGSRRRRGGKKIKTSSFKLFVGRATENSRAQGVTSDARGFLCIGDGQASFFPFRCHPFCTPLSTGAGYGPNESRITAGYQLMQQIPTRCHCAISQSV